MNGVFARNSTNDNFEFSILWTLYSQIWPWEMHSCPSKSPCGFSLVAKKSSFACLSNFEELFFARSPECIFFFKNFQNSKMNSGLLAKKKFAKTGQTSPNSIFWQQERTHTDFLVDKNAFPMARFGCKMPRKSKTQNCHLCHFLRIPRSYEPKKNTVSQKYQNSVTKFWCQLYLST